LKSHDSKKKNTILISVLLLVGFILSGTVNAVEVDYNDVFQPSGISTNYSFAYVTAINVDGIDVINESGVNIFQFNISDDITTIFPNRYLNLYTRNDGLEENLNVSSYTSRCPSGVKHTRSSPTAISEWLDSSAWNCTSEGNQYLTNITHYVNGSDVLDDETLSIFFGAYYNISSVIDEISGDSITFNVTFTNGTDTDIHNNITSYFAYYNDMNITGHVTSTLQSSGYTQRRYYETISETNDIIAEYSLISTVEGLLVRFHIENIQGNPISNAEIKAYHLTYGIVEYATTDSSGVGTMFLYPYNTYIIEVTHSSYTSLNSTIQPTSQDYTITLTGEAQEPAEEQLTNITYSILPTGGLSPINTTFSFTIHSFDSQLEWFAFNVTHNGTQLFSNNLTASSGGNITTIIDLSTLNWNASVVTYASFKKLNVTDEFWINTSYYILPETPSGLTDLLSIANWAKTTLDMETSNPYHKFFFGLGIIFLSTVAGAFVSSQGSGMLSLIVMGIGISLGLLTFVAFGTGIIVSVLFGILCLGYISYIYLRGNV